MNVKSAVIGLGAILILAGLGAYGVQAYLSHRAREDADMLLDQLPPGFTATHGAVGCGWLCDPLVLEDVTIKSEALGIAKIHIGRMTVNGPGPGLWQRLRGEASDAVAARSMVLEAMEADAEGGERDAIERATLIAPRLNRRYDRSRDSWTLIEWLRAFSLASAEATNLRQTLEGDHQSIATVREAGHAATLSMSGVKDGKLAGIAAKDASEDFYVVGIGRAHVEIAEARAENIDLVGVLTVSDPANYAGGRRDPTYYTIGSGAVSGVKTRFETQSFTANTSIDRFSLSDLKMRQLPFSPQAPPREPTPAQMLDLLQSFSLGRIELQNFTAGTQSRLFPSNFTLGHFVVEMGEGRLKRAAIEGVSFRMPALTYSLGIAELEGLEVRWPGLFETDPSDWERHPPGVPRIFFDRYRVADLAAQSPFAGSLSLKELTQTMSGTIDKPTGGRFDMSEFAIDLTMLSLVKPVRRFDYGMVTFAAHDETRYDPDARTFEIARMDFGAPEMGKISAALRLSDFSLDAFEANHAPEALGLAATAIRVDGAELRYDDASLLEHVFAVIGDNHGQTPEAARQAAIDATEEQNKSTPTRRSSAMPWIR